MKKLNTIRPNILSKISYLITQADRAQVKIYLTALHLIFEN